MNNPHTEDLCSHGWLYRRHATYKRDKLRRHEKIARTIVKKELP